MIEIEKKFQLTKEEIQRITENAVFIKEKNVLDTYYDTADYTLGIQDKWLRERDREFRMKTAVSKGGKKLFDQYHELEDESEIRKELLLAGQGTLRKDLFNAGYSPYCQFRTTRRKYCIGRLKLDLDHVDFGSSIYQLGEIEILVNSESEIPQAIEEISAFSLQHGLKIESTRGKVIEYLYREKPAHYSALVRHGIIQELT